MTSTRFTDLVGCERPLQLAGMGDVSTVGLATAVADAGGLGMLALPTSPAPSIEAALDALAGRTAGRIGINFLMPFLDPDCVKVAGGRAHGHRADDAVRPRPDAGPRVARRLDQGGVLGSQPRPRRHGLPQPVATRARAGVGVDRHGGCGMPAVRSSSTSHGSGSSAGCGSPATRCSPSAPWRSAGSCSVCSPVARSRATSICGRARRRVAGARGGHGLVSVTARGSCHPPTRLARSVAAGGPHDPTG